MKLIRPTLISLLAMACAGPALAIPANPSLDQRIVAIGERLAGSALPLCTVSASRAGFAVHSETQYGVDDRLGLRPRFAAPNQPAVLALAPDGAADRAGVQIDDGLLSIDGMAVPAAPPEPQPSFAATQAVIDQIDSAMLDGTMVLRVQRGPDVIELVITGQLGCPSHFLLLPSSSLRAQADGRFVQITSAQAALAADDAELASSLAHELAHNILRHRERLNAAGVHRGLAAHFGRNARLFRASEIEADRLSVYLMTLAGYDPEAALRFIDRLAAASGPTLATTHPSWDRRRAIIRAEIDRIGQLLAQGLPVRPGDDLTGEAALDTAPD